MTIKDSFSVNDDTNVTTYDDRVDPDDTPNDNDTKGDDKDD